MNPVFRKDVENPAWIASLKKGDRVTYAYGGNASGHAPSRATVCKKGKTFIDVLVDRSGTGFKARLGCGGVQGFVNANYFMFLAPSEKIDEIQVNATRVKAFVEADLSRCRSQNDPLIYVNAVDDFQKVVRGGK